MGGQILQKLWMSPKRGKNCVSYLAVDIKTAHYTTVPCVMWCEQPLIENMAAWFSFFPRFSKLWAKKTFLRQTISMSTTQHTILNCKENTAKSDTIAIQWNCVWLFDKTYYKNIQDILAIKKSCDISGPQFP